MSTNILKEINTSAKILIILFLIFMLFVTNSIFFIGFEFILILIMIIISDESVRKYYGSIKVTLCLLPIFIILFILFKNIILIVYLKTFMSIVLLNILLVTTSFLNLYNGIYTLFRLYYRNERRLNKKCLNIASRIYFLNKYLNGNEKIDNALKRGLNKKQTKNYLKSKYLLASNDSNFIKNKLSLKIYKAHFEKINKKSKIYLIFTMILAIIVVIKEVI